jgi:tetratricopeptide (TPR) repeat protein
VAAHTVPILSSSLPIEERNKFYSFATSSVVGWADKYPGDTRYQIIAGSLLSSTGKADEALKYLKRAEEITPGKQQIYYEEGSLYINSGKPREALNAFKTAYEMAPDNTQALAIYLAGSIYASDRNLENELLSKLPSNALVQNAQVILSAYVAMQRRDSARSLLEQIEVARPDLKVQIDSYIEQLNK